MRNNKWILLNGKKLTGHYLVIDDENVIGLESDPKRIKIGWFETNGTCWVNGHHFNATHFMELPSPVVDK
jgi:hypothetical protein